MKKGLLLLLMIIISLISVSMASGIVPSFTWLNITSTNTTGNIRTAVADFDNDGIKDIVMTHQDNDFIAWYNGSDNYSDNIFFSGRQQLDSPMGVDVGYFDEDSNIDVVVCNFGNYDSGVKWFKGDGAGGFTIYNVSTQDGNHQCQEVFVVDLDGDTDDDIISGIGTGISTKRVVWYENNGSGTFTENVLLASASFRWLEGIDSVDIDGDGDKDIVTGHTLDDYVLLFKNNGSQTFTLSIITSGTSVVNGPNKVKIGDVDYDGDEDVVACGGTGALVVFYNNGTEDFTNYTRFAGNSTGCEDVDFVDIDSDGYGEIVYKGTAGNIYYSEVNYSSRVDITPSGVVGSLDDFMTINDIDDDGDFDISNGLNLLLSNVSTIVCNDSDGTNFTVKGNVTEPSFNGTDYCLNDVSVAYACNQTVFEFTCGIGGYTYVEKDCRDFGADYNCIDGRCIQQNERPVIHNITSYRNESGGGQHHFPRYSIKDRIWWEIDVTDNECDAIYADVDCDKDTYPPGVSADWGNANQNSTIHANCTYVEGNYTARIYVTDDEHWDYTVFEDDTFNVTECLTYHDCDSGYLCHTSGVDRGSCYLPTNVTGCIDSDGLDYNVTGNISIYVNVSDPSTLVESVNDSCTTPNVLAEPFCDSGYPSGYQTTLFNCQIYGTEWICFDGRCTNTTNATTSTLTVRDFSTDVLLSDVEYYFVKVPPISELVASGTVTNGVQELSLDLGFQYRITLDKDEYRQWLDYNWIPVPELNAYMRKYCYSEDCVFFEDFDFGDDPSHYGWRSGDYQTDYIGGLGLVADLNLSVSTDEFYVEFPASESNVLEISYSIALSDTTPADGQDIIVYLRDSSDDDIFAMRYQIDGTSVSHVYYFSTTWKEITLAEDFEATTPVTTKLYYNKEEGDMDIYVDSLTTGDFILYSIDRPVINALNLEEISFDPVVPTHSDRHMYITYVKVLEFDYEPAEEEEPAEEREGYPTPSSADLDSPWYRDDEGDMHFNSSKCGDSKSMILCAGRKYAVAQMAGAVGWVFTGVHILYVIVALILLVLIGPLVVELLKKWG